MEELSKAAKVWKGVFTPDQLRQLGLGDDEDRKSKRPRRKGPTRSNSESSSVDTRELLQALIRLTLRHEDSLNVILQEFQFTLFISPGECSLLPTLLLTHKDWKANPTNVTLRHTMAVKTVEALQERLHHL